MTQTLGGNLSRLIFATALALYLLSLNSPGGYVAWSGLRVIVLLVSELWVLSRWRELSWPVRLLSTAAILLALSVHWLNGTRHSNRFCADRTLEAKTFKEWIVPTEVVRTLEYYDGVIQ